jgi:hypothetical protein
VPIQKTSKRESQDPNFRAVCHYYSFIFFIILSGVRLSPLVTEASTGLL